MSVNIRTEVANLEDALHRERRLLQSHHRAASHRRHIALWVIVMALEGCMSIRGDGRMLSTSETCTGSQIRGQSCNDGAAPRVKVSLFLDVHGYEPVHLGLAKRMIYFLPLRCISCGSEPRR